MSDDNEIQEFMYRKLGGRDAVLRELNRSKVADLLCGGRKTIADLLAAFRNENGELPDWFLGMPLEELRATGCAMPFESSSSPATGRRRSSRAEVEELASRLLALVRCSPTGISRGKIAEGLGVESAQLSTVLIKLKRANQIACEGERGAAVYRAVDDSAAPAADLAPAKRRNSKKPVAPAPEPPPAA